MMRRATLLSTAAMLLATPALAAPSAAAPPVVAAATGEDIVVTAEKRSQTLINVPQSVTVVSGAALERQAATTFEDYLKLIPGLQIDQDTPGETRLILRGLNTGGVGSTVAVYQDETPFGSSTGQANGAILAGDFDTFDIARIEVLRGPQGTLYGASALGGVVKFVTNLPDTDRLAGRARAGVETTQGGDISYYGNAMINLPLTGTLAFRASGSYRKDGGWIDSIGTGGSRVRTNINDARVYGGRASLLFMPTPDISLRLSALFQNFDVNAPSIEESDGASLATLYGRPTQSIFVSPYRDIRYRVYDATATIGLGFATLTSSTSYSTQKQPSRTDETTLLSGLIAGVFGTPNELYLGQNTNVRRFTQEVRLAGSAGSIFDWTVGGYYDHENALIFQQYFPVVPGTLTPVTGLPLLAIANLPSRYDEIAGFANATVHLGRRFDVEFGGRYSHNSQDASEILDGALVGGPSNLFQRSSEGVFTYSVAPKIKFSDNASLYGRVAKGFRPGGPNPLGPGAPASAATYLSDSVVSYEVGFKAQTADKVASIDIDVFHIDWSRIQLLTTIQTPDGPFSYNGNGGAAKSDGVEFTGTVRPTPGFDVSLNGALTNARLTEDAPAAGGMAGDKLPFVPRYSVSLNGDYQWPLTGEVKAFAGASLRYPVKAVGRVRPDLQRGLWPPRRRSVVRRRRLARGRRGRALYGRGLCPQPQQRRRQDFGHAARGLSQRCSGDRHDPPAHGRAERHRRVLRMLAPDTTRRPQAVAPLPSPYLLFLGDATAPAYAKTAFGLKDWAGEACVGEFALPAATVTTGLPRLSPAEARLRGARAAVIGVAIEGGQIAPHWVPALIEALDAGLDLISGMHQRLGDVAALADAAKRTGCRLIDVRVPPPGIAVATGAQRPGRRLLTVGTDCALGKKYAALALARAFAARGVATDFRATGQTGIMIAGTGIAIDSVVSDFAAGAAEMLSPAAAADHWDVIEGQGSLFHPAYAAVSLALLHGSQPDVFVVCHDPLRTHVMGLPGVPLPSLAAVIEQTVALGRLTNPAIRCAGLALNTARLAPAAAAATIAEQSARLGLPAADPVRGGPAFDALVDACLR